MIRPAPRLARGQTLALATHNRGKLAEFEALLAPYGIGIVSAFALGLVAPEEDAPDFAGNARIKARAAADASGLVSLADDSGFGVASLDGAPGVRSARWAGPDGDFAAAMERVRTEAEASRLGAGDRRAAFVCALCIAWPGSEDVPVFEGRVEGGWTWPPRGRDGFGYDAMFVPEGSTRTYAEMTREEKSRTSHRARAFAAFAAALLGPPEVSA